MPRDCRRLTCISYYGIPPPLIFFDSSHPPSLSSPTPSFNEDVLYCPELYSINKWRTSMMSTHHTQRSHTGTVFLTDSMPVGLLVPCLPQYVLVAFSPVETCLPLHNASEYVSALALSPFARPQQEQERHMGMGKVA